MADFQSTAIDHHVPERRKNDELMFNILQQVSDSHVKLVDRVGMLSDKMILFGATLENQVDTIEKYNNFGNRILTLEQTQKTCMEHCASIQQEKKDAKKGRQIPWGVIVTGSILILVSTIVNAVIMLAIK